MEHELQTSLAALLTQNQLEQIAKELRQKRPALRMELMVPARKIVPAYPDPQAVMQLRFALLVNTTTGQRAYVCKQLGQALTLESVMPALREHGLAS